MKQYPRAAYEVVEDRKEGMRPSSEEGKEGARMRAIRRQRPGEDSEARRIKKAGKLRYGYKKHLLTDGHG